MRNNVCFFNDTATTEIYTLALHDALPIFWKGCMPAVPPSRSALMEPLERRTLFAAVAVAGLTESTVVLNQLTRPTAMEFARSEEHTSEIQSRQYLVCRLLLEKKTTLSNCS